LKSFLFVMIEKFGLRSIIYIKFDSLKNDQISIPAMAFLTLFTPLSNQSFSSWFKSSSLIFSTPFYPITAGTPIVTSE